MSSILEPMFNSHKSQILQRSKLLAVALGALALVIVAGCGGGSSATTEMPTIQRGRVQGSVTLPPPTRKGQVRTTEEIEDLLRAQEGVGAAKCQMIPSRSFARRWSCSVLYHGHKGMISMRIDHQGIISSTGNGIPGLSFG